MKCDQQGIFAQNNIALNPTLHRNAAAMMQCINPNLIAVAFELHLLFRRWAKKKLLLTLQSLPFGKSCSNRVLYLLFFVWVTNTAIYVLRSAQMYFSTIAVGFAKLMSKDGQPARSSATVPLFLEIYFVVVCFLSIVVFDCQVQFELH